MNDNKFWVEYIFSKYRNLDQLSTSMNMLSLFTILFFWLLYYLKYPAKLVFILMPLTLIFIIIIYYIQKNMIQKEYYSQSIDLKKIYDNEKPYHRLISPVDDNSRRFEKTFNSEDLYINDNIQSNNQKLVGPPNPKTLEKPLIVPPIYNFEYWKTNNLVIPSIINKKTNFDNYRSGYSSAVPLSQPAPPPEGRLQSGPYVENYTRGNSVYEVDRGAAGVYEVDGSIGASRATNCRPTGGPRSNRPENKFPENKIGGRGMTQEENKNIYTQIIQPGLYSAIQINEPISSTIGISYQDQFNPVSITSSGNETTITEQKYGEVINSDFVEQQTPNIYNTFDPRFNGYGSSNRYYLDNTTEQPRFFYDDINAIKMPNYITRSNVDFIKNADTYGPLKSGVEYGQPFSDVRQMAEDQYLNSALEFRSGMMESLMRKRNSEMHQLRLAPISRNNQKQSGGFGRF